MADVYLPADSQRRLIRISREALEDFVRGRFGSQPESSDPYLDTSDYGAFVTFFKDDELQDCIGRCVPTDALWCTVIEMTEVAAARDRRMTPVSADELEQVPMDVSVMSPLEQASDSLSPIIGEHGLQIGRKGKRGVLLPQVATEREWDMKTFLEQTCVKAQLPKNLRRWPDTMVCSCTALIIEEEG